LDPFVGGGTTALAALELERRCLGFDISGKYIARAKERVETLRESLAVDLLGVRAVNGSNRKASGKERRRKARGNL